MAVTVSPEVFPQAGIVAPCNAKALEGAAFAGLCCRKVGNTPCNGTCVIIQGDIRIYSLKLTLVFILMLIWYDLR